MGKFVSLINEVNYGPILRICILRLQWYIDAYTPDTVLQIFSINKKDTSEHVCILTLPFCLPLFLSFILQLFWVPSWFSSQGYLLIHSKHLCIINAHCSTRWQWQIRSKIYWLVGNVLFSHAWIFQFILLVEDFSVEILWQNVLYTSLLLTLSSHLFCFST